MTTTTTHAPRTSTSPREDSLLTGAIPERVNGYLPIGSYGLIGDCRSAALVGVDGSIDWLCLTRFDAPAVFGRILDAGKGGSWQLHPDQPHYVHQRYRDRTNLLDTVFSSATGLVVVTDFMPVDERSVVQHAKPHNFPRVVRLVECLAGEVTMHQVFDPAPAACASDWQCLSAPSIPPRSAPLPGPALVKKKLADCACAGCAAKASAATVTRQRHERVF